MRVLLAGLLFLGLLATAEAEAPANQAMTFRIAAQSLDSALVEFSQQSGLQLVVTADTTRGKSTRGVQGSFKPQKALAVLLKGSGLDYSVVNERSLAIRPEKPNGQAEQVKTSLTDNAGRPLQLARVEGTKDGQVTGAAREQAADADLKGVPEILVKGSRSLNTDIKRSEEDPQPYVVFDREQVQRSQAVNLEEFLRTRLPMNTAMSAEGQTPGVSSTRSSINLRGLGTNQTLILVDGRRMPGISNLGSLGQPDINGIPLSAIERIEVLPSTAGGIYGGSATGGVINIVLRRDMQRLEAGITYANTFDSDTASRRMDLSGSLSLEGGRTQVLVAATASDGNILTIGDRDFATRAIALQMANNRNAITALTTPPLGATVNIRSVSGNLVLDPAYGGTPLGFNTTHIPLGYRGPGSDNGAALVANAGTYNLDMPAGVGGRERGLVASPSMESVSLNARREFTASLEGFLTLSRLGNNGSSPSSAVPTSVTNLLPDAPNNPFQQAINVRFPVPGLAFEDITESTTTQVTGGFIARLPHHWTGEVSYGWGRSNFKSASTGNVLDNVATRATTGVLATGRPAADGRPALDVLQEQNTFPLDFTPYMLPRPNLINGPYVTTLKDATLRLSGPTARLPGGDLGLSFMVERRKEAMDDAFNTFIDTTTREFEYTMFPRKSQDADSYYVEARAPLVSAANSLPWVRELELQVSGRHDAYTTRSSAIYSTSVPSRDGPYPALTFTTAEMKSTDYTLGLRYAPLEDLALRTSFGTGFLPPSVRQVAPVVQPLTGSVGNDPRRGGTSMYVGVPYQYTSGGNPGLKPENSRSLSVGMILTPRLLPGLRVSVDYTKIDKTDEIYTTSAQFFMNNEDLFPGRIVRGPNLAGDQPGWAGPITAIDSTPVNLASTSVQAYDIQADYTLTVERFGEFHAYAIATRQANYETRLLSTSPVIEYVDFSDGRGLKWRGNIGIDWVRGAMTLGWNAQFYDSYFGYSATATPTTISTFRLNQGADRVPSQMYHDVIVTYRVDGNASLIGRMLGNSQISFGIQNVLDKSPPILASTSPASAGYSLLGDPRLRRYTVSLRKEF